MVAHRKRHCQDIRGSVVKAAIHLIAAARPNMMKVAPLYHALKNTDWAKPVLVHTGQHYDDNMSGVFLREFALPEPDHALHIGSGTYAEQTGRTMIAYEALCLRERPALCVVVGDVNATLACAITAKKLNIQVAHLEAGLRSFDRSMPEEINRLATDAIADWHWTPSADASKRLVHEGIDAARIREVGNIIIDTYEMCAPMIAANDAVRRVDGAYAVVTFHRPSNVDNPLRLQRLCGVLRGLADLMPVFFPVHPRTRHKLDDTQLAHPRLHVCAPLPYLAFMNLVTHARLTVTDSGGLQEETTYLGIPCLTLRENTERPVTITHGTNELVSFDTVLAAAQTVLARPLPPRPRIPGWDGHAAGRIAAHIKEILTGAPSGAGARFSAMSGTDA